MPLMKYGSQSEALVVAEIYGDQNQAQGGATEREREFSYFLCSDGCETCLLFDRT